MCGMTAVKALCQNAVQSDVLLISSAGASLSRNQSRNEGGGGQQELGHPGHMGAFICPLA